MRWLITKSSLTVAISIVVPHESGGASSRLVSFKRLALQPGRAWLVGEPLRFLDRTQSLIERAVIGRVRSPVQGVGDCCDASRAYSPRLIGRGVDGEPRFEVPEGTFQRQGQAPVHQPGTVRHRR